MSLITLKTTSWYVRKDGSKGGENVDYTYNLPVPRLEGILESHDIKRLLNKEAVVVEMIGKIFFKYQIV